MRINKIALLVGMAKKDYTLKRLSEVCGVSLQTLSCIKNGKRCSTQTATAIASALGVDVEELTEN